VKTLTLVHRRTQRPPLAELERLEAEDEWPRVTLYEKRLESDLLDEQAVTGVPGFRGWVYGRVPVGVAQAMEGFRRRKGYDAIVSWAEDLGLPLAALLKVTGDRTPHVALFGWLSSPRKAAVLRRVHSHIHRLIVWSRIQHDFAIQQAGVPPEKVVLLRWLVDTRFWRPLERPVDGICSAGREMRDYATLIRALEGWSVRCHIAANPGPGRKDRWMTDVAGMGPIPPNVTMGPLSYRDLRERYARSRFVVLPILPTDTDNGVTAMLEAMAMGKAVICSRVEGQRDVLQDGVNGIFVPPEDPRALRQAMEHLWAHPEECERMGREGRRHVERHHSFDQWVEDVRRVVEEAVAEARASR
jgi:glycosyltransferase involved in cell wall biosynthesis